MSNNYILLNPGPVNLHYKVREAAVSVDMCHRQKDFIDILMSVKNKILEVSKKQDSNLSILHGSGDLSIEASLYSLISGKVLVINNGYYCQRIIDYLNLIDDVVVSSIELPLGICPSSDMLFDYIRKDIYDWIIIVHHETTTGVLNPLSIVCDLVEGSHTRIMVDAVSSFGGHEVDRRADIICTNSNKCLESIPGASIVIWDKNLKTRKNIPFYFNLYNYIDDKIPYTPNVNAILALNVALDLYKEENRIERYRRMAFCVRNIGGQYFDLFLKSNYSNVLTTFVVDPNKFENIYKKAEENGFIIYRGKVDNQFRIANMGVVVNRVKIECLFKLIGG